MKAVTSLALVALTVPTAAVRAESRVSSDGKVVVGTASSGAAPIDYANAKPMPLPKSTRTPPSSVDLAIAASKARFSGLAKVVAATEGNGKMTPTSVPASKYVPKDTGGGVSSQEYGASGQPYTTSRIAATANPVRRAGKLFFNDQGNSYVCSASLIRPGVVVTAAHCVASFGQSRYHSDFVYIPAYTGGAAPYGTWNGVRWYVLSPYYNGTDTCAASAPGVICEDDVAVIVLAAKSGAYPGAQTGTFGYAVNGTYYKNGQALITQLGYPVNLDDGEYMERTDSTGSVDADFANNTIIGSLQTGGSSGGPWVVNLGLLPGLSGGTEYGYAKSHNLVVGVTSWGYDDSSRSGPKQQGASPFTSNNIDVLVNNACAAVPAAC